MWMKNCCCYGQSLPLLSRSFKLLSECFMLQSRYKINSKQMLISSIICQHDLLGLLKSIITLIILVRLGTVQFVIIFSFVIPYLKSFLIQIIELRFFFLISSCISKSHMPSLHLFSCFFQNLCSIKLVSEPQNPLCIFLVFFFVQDVAIVGKRIKLQLHFSGHSSVII